jgi:YVTN family beta-propeller protein
MRFGFVTGAVAALALSLAACSQGPEGFSLRLGPRDIYAGAGAGRLSAAVKGELERVYAPDIGSDDVYVIDPATLEVVDHYPVGRSPQHVVPAWDLKSLWVTGSAEDGRSGSLTKIDPFTARAVKFLTVDDAYNMYFAPDGSSAIVVAEQRRALEFRDPQTMAFEYELPTPGCDGVNHADFAPDYSYAIFTCEFGGALAKVDVRRRKVLAYLKLAPGAMPQDIRSSPDGSVFYVADMTADGVRLIDGNRFREVGFLPTGRGAHGLTPSRDGRSLYVSNRGSHTAAGPPRGPGGVSVIDFATRKVVANWPIPGGGSPDMGAVSADGTTLWLSGRFDDVVYAIDTRTGAVTKIPVGHTPHGLTIWPQPGSHSLGHTGIMR